jgi:hypothetical protein
MSIIGFAASSAAAILQPKQATPPATAAATSAQALATPANAPVQQPPQSQPSGQVHHHHHHGGGGEAGQLPAIAQSGTNAATSTLNIVA